MLVEIFTKYKKQIKLLAAGLVVLWIGMFIWNYLRYGVISVSSDEDAIITISQLGEENKSNQKLFSETASGSLSARVSPGRYIVNIGRKDNAINKFVQVKRQQKTSLKLTPPNNQAYEPVIGTNATDLSVDKNNLSFLNPKTEVPFQINPANKVSNLSDSINFLEIKWADPNFGVGVDADNQLYIVKNKSVSKISLPGAKTSGVGFAVSRNHKIYISIGADIYSYSSADMYKKIYTSAASIHEMAASNDSVALINPPPNDKENNSNEKNNNIFVEVIDENGKPVSKKPIFANRGIWSPDGTKLLLISFFGGGSSGSNEIYDKNLNILKTIPNTNISTGSWIDNDSFAFVVNNAIWVYELNGEQSKTLTNLSVGEDVLGLTADSDSRLLYFSYMDSGEQPKPYINRVGLDDKSFDRGLVGLSVFLPASLGSCTIDYVNFKGLPTIVMNTSKNNLKLCKTQAQIELVQDGLGQKKFRYQPNISSKD